MALTDPSGTVVTVYSYEPFGRTEVAGSSSGNPFQYTGRESDGTGLYYYRARYYHPKLQRFISEDPIALRGGDTNFYAYVRNRPTRYIDRWGLQQIEITDPVFGPSNASECIPSLTRVPFTAINPRAHHDSDLRRLTRDHRSRTPL